MKRIRLKKDELISLFAQNPDLKQEVHPNFSSPVIFLPDGKVLITTWDGAIECDNYEEAFKVFGRPRKEDDPLRWSNLIPDPQVFLNDLSGIYRYFNEVYMGNFTLPPLAEISVSDLARLDQLAMKHGSEFILQPVNFQYVVACIGEAFRLYSHGEWNIVSRIDEYGDEINVPIVVADNGYRVDIPGLVRKELIEWDEVSDALSSVYYAATRGYKRHAHHGR